MPSAPEPVSTAEVHFWDHADVLVRRRRLVLAVLLAVSGLGALRVLLVRPVYRATTQILIERENPRVLSFDEVTAVDAGRDDYYQTQYKLLQSRTLAHKVILRLNLLQEREFGGPRAASEVETVTAAVGSSQVMEAAIDKFQERLLVQPVRNSRLVTVSFEANRPEIAARAANQLSRFYLEQALEFRQETSSDAARWLSRQIEEQRAKVEAAEAALQKLKEQEGIVNIEERRQLLDQKLKELGTALTTLKTRRLEKEALFHQMKRVTNPEELPEVVGSPLVQTLRSDIALLERQQTQLSEKYLEEHPEILKVRNQIQEARRRVAAEAQRVIRSAENDYKAAAAQEASIASALEASKDEALELSRRGMQYDSLKREMDASKQVLDSLLARSKQTDVSQALTSSNIRIVDPATIPRTPVRPRRLRDTLAGVGLGLALGIFLAFVLEYLGDTVNVPEDVKGHVGVPLLGVVPEHPSPGTDPVLGRVPAQTPFAEGYRVVRTSLNYSWPERAPRVVLVTSPSSGEGKSLTTVNLAVTLGALREGVVVVDADLRQPQAHRLLRARKTPGLSDVLVGRADLSHALQRTESGVSLLSAGTPVPSPADLLTAEALAGLLAELRLSHRWILIDAPPVAAVVEPLVMASVADGVLLVLRAGTTARKAARTAVERIAATGVRVLGGVLNRATITKRPYYYGSLGGYQDEGRADGTAPKVTDIHDKRVAH